LKNQYYFGDDLMIIFLEILPGDEHQPKKSRRNKQNKKTKIKLCQPTQKICEKEIPFPQEDKDAMSIPQITETEVVLVETYKAFEFKGRLLG
jgi:hypothetical protein